MVKKRIPRLAEMTQTVREELQHIPRGDAQQQELRMLYQVLRMKSLGRKGKGESKEEVLKEAIASVKEWKPNLDFKPQYDEDYFKLLAPE